MRYLVLCLGLFLGLQSAVKAQNLEIPHNEVNYNLLNTILFESVEVGYEYFIDYDQSVGAKLLINDRRNFKKETRDSKYKTNSFQLNYTYYFGTTNPGSGIYVQPFVKYRFGSYQEKVKDAENTFVKQVKTDMNAFIIGAGLGYEWNFSNSFVMGPYLNFGRNFSSEVKNRFSAYEVYGGFLFGYRF